MFQGMAGFRRRVTVFAALAALAAAPAEASERPGAAEGTAPMSRPAGAFDVATFWFLSNPKCATGEVPTPGGCVCETGLSRIDGLCVVAPPPPPKVADQPPPPAPPPPKRTTQKKTPPKVAKRPPAGVAGYEGGTPCMDADLVALMTGAYGKKPAGVVACNAGCLPRPKGTLRSKADLDALAKANGVSWCPESCIEVTGWMPPAEVLRLERLTGRSFCPTDGQNYCRAPEYVGVPVATTVEKVLAFSPAATPPPPPPGSVALVLGFGGYRSGIPGNDHAERDAAAFKALLTDRLGYPADAVVARDNLTRADLLKILAPDGDLAKAKPTNSVILYVSGHGLSDPATGRAYLLPVDADPARLGDTAVALQDVYDALGKLGTPGLTVALEASFPTSVSDLVDPPNLPDTDVAVLPEKPIPGLSVFTAADRNQQTLVDPELGTGLFTRWLLEGLSGAADADPTGNGDRKIESVELYVYTAHHVRVTARKSFGLEQKPLISESANSLMRSF